MLDYLFKIVKNNINSQYLITSIMLHVVVFGILLVNFSFNKIIKPVNNINNNINNSEKIIIKATAVDIESVDKEIARLDHIEKIEQDKKEESRNKEIILEKKLKEDQVKLNQLKEQQVKEAIKITEQKKKSEELKKAELKAKQDLAKKHEETQRVEVKLKQKKQEELLARLKAEQEKKLLSSLESEEELLTQNNARITRHQREIENIISLQQAKVSRSWTARDSFFGKNLIAKLDIRLSRDGQVISVKIVKSSGDAALDISAQNAVLKASPLPVPDNDELFKTFANYRFTFRPDDLS